MRPIDYELFKRTYCNRWEPDPSFVYPYSLDDECEIEKPIDI